MREPTSLRYDSSAFMSVVVVVPDPRVGHHPTTGDDAQWWLPVLGPTAFLLARFLAQQVATGAGNAGVRVDTELLAYRLGLNHGVSKLRMSFKRLEDFHVGRFQSTEVFSIRTRLPMLAPVQLARFPLTMIQEYQDLVMHQINEQRGEQGVR